MGQYYFNTVKPQPDYGLNIIVIELWTGNQHCWIANLEKGMSDVLLGQNKEPYWVAAYLLDLSLSLECANAAQEYNLPTV